MRTLKNRSSLLILAAFALVPADACLADTINLGFVQFLMGSDSTAGFNVLNQTGPNGAPFPDTSFPVVTTVPLSDLTLTINFADGTTKEFLPTSGYFSLASDNLSFMGHQISDFVAKPISFAVLSGSFGATDLTLNDGSSVNIGPSFFEFITDSSGDLKDGDFSLITGSTPVSAVPEPAMTTLLAMGIVGLGVHRFRRRLRVP
jgi:hypothetical protein